jgi:hypothetical protein
MNSLKTSMWPVVQQARKAAKAELSFYEEMMKSKFPERDTSIPAEAQGIFRKFVVTRVDGSDKPGGKHEGCEYFVLDINHDIHAGSALVAYAKACKETHPELSADILNRYGITSSQLVSNIEQELKSRILSLETENIRLRKQVSDDGWRLNPDRMGGSFSDAEIREYSEWR